MIIMTKKNNELLFMYRHHTRKIASLIKYSFTGNLERNLSDFILDLSLQVVAKRPDFLHEIDIGQEYLKQMHAEQEYIKLNNLPEMHDKIIQGIIRKKLKKSVFLNQDFVKNGAITIKKLIADFNKETEGELILIDFDWLTVI